MKLRYQFVLTALIAAAFLWPAAVQAQDAPAFTSCLDTQDECLVDYYFNGGIVNNALRNTIIDDIDNGGVPAGRVYKLLRGGLYYNEDRIENAGFHLRIVGQTKEEAGPDAFACGDSGDQDCGPAVIQMVTRADGSIDQRMITGQDDITLRNLWITGQDDAGLTNAYTPIQIDASNHRYVFDNIIFERSNFALVQFTGQDNDVKVMNSKFRNFVNSAQQWEGRGMQFSAGADSVWFENNTFFQVGFTVVQSEARPINYILFNHNTMVNIGRQINTGGIWKSAFFTNNLLVNGFWHGEGYADINTPGRDTETAGLFSIAELPAQYGTNLERRIVFANTSTWRDPKFAAYYADSIRAQPLFNEVTAEFFADYDNMQAVDNLEGVDPGLKVYPQLTSAGVIENMIQNMKDLRAGVTPAQTWLWDPGRDATNFLGVGFVWPLPEDLSYTNATLMTAGTDNLPLGDLNWFPTAKETYTNNRMQYIHAIENMAVAPEVNIVATVEAEAGSLQDQASVATVAGATFLKITPGSSFSWTFEIPESKEYALDYHLNMAGRATSGVDMVLNGTNIFDLRGWGQFVVPPENSGVALNDWVTLRYTQADLHTNSAGALTLPAGTNTLKIGQQWADNTMWSGVDVVDPGTGNIVASLTAPEAMVEGAAPGCVDPNEYCPSGFKSVNIENGSVTWTIDVPSAGQYFARVFYNAPDGGTGTISIDGAPAVPVVTFDAANGNVLTSEFTIATTGSKTVTLTANGGVMVDRIQLLNVRAVTSSEKQELPEGYALDQNYPNPFSVSTTIAYTMKAAGSVRLEVYDLLGRSVATLVDAQVGAGAHTVTFDGSALNLPSGLYLYRLQTPVGNQVRKMMLVQ